MLVCGPLAASFSFFASALAAHFPLMGNSISFCPAAAFRGCLLTPTECANYQAMPNPNCIML
jgi:hypothetical protein